jgi:hypothetical protein
VHVRGIAYQEDVSGAIAVGLSAVLPGDAAQGMWAVADGRLDGQIDAEYPTGAVAQLVEGHRLGLVRALVVLDGADHLTIALERGIDEPAAVESVVAERQRPHPGHVESAVGGEHFVGDTDMGDAGDGVGRMAGKVDAGKLPHRTAPSVGSDEIRGLEHVRLV